MAEPVSTESTDPAGRGGRRTDVSAYDELGGEAFNDALAAIDRMIDEEQEDDDRHSALPQPGCNVCVCGVLASDRSTHFGTMAEGDTP